MILPDQFDYQPNSSCRLIVTRSGTVYEEPQFEILYQYFAKELQVMDELRRLGLAEYREKLFACTVAYILAIWLLGLLYLVLSEVEQWRCRRNCSQPYWRRMAGFQLKRVGIVVVTDEMLEDLIEAAAIEMTSPGREAESQ